MNMKPTPQLRFIERYVPAAELGENIGKQVRILQQWWEEDVPTANIGFGEIQLKQPTGEWRDVPLEKEA
jgi:hypothetical protein